jgi:MFS family permease
MRNSGRIPTLLILFATLMASAGDGISLVAFPWLVLQHENSARQASIVAGAITVPLLFSTLIAGTAVDYFGRRRVSMAADALSGAAVAGVPLVAWAFGAGAVNVGVLAALGALSAAFDPAGMTARQSMPRPPPGRAGRWTAPTAPTRPS